MCLRPFMFPILSVSEWVKVARSRPTLCNPMDYTVHGILQARILEWVAFPSPGDLPNPGIEPRSPTLQADSLPVEPQGKPKNTGVASSGSSRSRNRTGVSCIALEKEMATHSSVLAWRIPGMGDPGRLQSLGSHRVRHNWSDLAAAAAGLQADSLPTELFTTPWNKVSTHLHSQLLIETNWCPQVKSSCRSVSFYHSFQLLPLSSLFLDNSTPTETPRPQGRSLSPKYFKTQGFLFCFPVASSLMV